MPREVDPLVYNMSHEDPGDVKYSSIGGLSEQIRELREVSVTTETSIMHLFIIFVFSCDYLSNVVAILSMQLF